MKTEVGVWIDHRRAVVVTLADEGESTTHIMSNMEPHVRYSGAAREDSAEDQRDRRFTGHLNQYYDEVIARIRGAESILLLGPGEAKGELAARLGEEGLRARVVGIQTADKLTDRQVAARVRQRFVKGGRRLLERVAV